MAELKFETGVQSYTVHGVKGDVVIRFNPTDGAFIQRLYNAFNVLDERQEKYANEIQRFIPRRAAGTVPCGP